MRRTSLLLMTALLATTATAQTIADERARLVEARREAVLATRRAERFEAAAHRAIGAADAARDRSAAFAARIQESEARIAAVHARMIVIERMRARQQRDLAHRQKPIVQLIAALQSMASRPPALVLVQPGSLDDMIHARLLLDAALPVIRARTAGLQAEMDQSARLRDDARLAVVSLRAEQTLLATRRLDLARLEAGERIRSRQLGNSAMLEQERAQGMGEKARDLIDLMAQMDVQAGISAQLASLPGPMLRPPVPGDSGAPAPEPPPIVAGRPAYRLPVLGRIVAGIGEVSSAGIRSRGLTFASIPGAQIIAPAGGHIRYAGPFRGYGQIVIIDHGQGWTTLLTGLDSISIAVGDSVVQGSPLGRAGPLNPRVTVELRHEGQVIDIAPLAVRG